MPQSSTGSSSPLPLGGAFYWLPTPTSTGSISWALLTCHEFRLWDGISHREMWPSVLEHIAPAWGKDPESLKRHLRDHYYALPRGRVTRPKGKCLILHGDDAPSPGWKQIIITRFNLHGLRVRTPWDEHEQTLRDDVLALEEALGVDLGLPGV